MVALGFLIFLLMIRLSIFNFDLYDVMPFVAGC